MPYAEVAVDAPAGRSTYTYDVPEGLAVRRGQLVWVPFGTRVVRGVVLDIVAESEQPATRPVASASQHVVLSPSQLELASFISSRYLSTLFQALSLFLPPGTERRSKVVYEAVTTVTDSVEGLTALEAELLQRVSTRGTMAATSLRSTGTRDAVESALSALVGRGLLTRRELPVEVRPRMKTETIISLCADAAQPVLAGGAPDGVRARRPYDLIRYLADHGGSASAAELKAARLSTPAVLRSLQARGLVCLQQRRVWRQTLSGRVTEASPPVLLTAEQAEAVTQLCNALEAGVFSEHLLFGVTGSGKTEVYIRAAEHALAAGRQVFCLVPEIALAAQTVERFVSRFPGRVALLHSGLTAGQLADEWDRVSRGDADIVVGARSALFAPLTRPGLFVLDEEHEWTYKQEDVAPRYHARDVARELARSAGAVLLLGSATPDVGTFHRAVSGETELHLLPERIGGTVGLPPVAVVDMRMELRAGNADVFSRSLQQALAETYARGEQALLFLNRRGTATLVQCRHCGYTFSCPRCSVALAHHAVSNRLVCHRCGYSSAVPAACPRCRSHSIRFLGIGTQRVAAAAGALLPEARIMRWDSDVPATQRAGAGLQDAVRAQSVDVIVGTQMVAKGHDFPKVTLVGIIGADLGLAVPDFRSSERTFQLISQASGRAGRGVRPGRVVIQTYSPGNYVIESAATHDYRSFYQQEIRYREESGYPPFSLMLLLVYSHSNEGSCRREVERVHRELSRRARATDLQLTGPAPAYVQRLRGRYRWQFTVRGTRPEEALLGVALPRGWVVDVDPGSVA